MSHIYVLAYGEGKVEHMERDSERPTLSRGALTFILVFAVGVGSVTGVGLAYGLTQWASLVIEAIGVLAGVTLGVIEFWPRENERGPPSPS